MPFGDLGIKEGLSSNSVDWFLILEKNQWSQFYLFFSFNGFFNQAFKPNFLILEVFNFVHFHKELKIGSF